MKRLFFFIADHIAFVLVFLTGLACLFIVRAFRSRAVLPEYSLLVRKAAGFVFLGITIVLALVYF